MSSFSDQIEEIKSLIHSNSKASKSLAYSTLLLLQQQSINHPSSIQTLANSSQTLISIISVDISNDDEEIASQALKCLGFFIYHPSIVATIPDDDANMILEALAKVIIATKIKVVIKLAAQFSEKMRESSHIWAPPIYRRLLSMDKRERDISERCLLKIKSAIIPPPTDLSKALVKDMKLKLLTGMKGLLNQGMKVQTLQAWGWFIRLLGSQALKNRRLINDMLKIPEQTFSDHSPQVQITSLAAWEGLVVALIQPPLLTCETDEVADDGCQVQASTFSKSIKLLMTPLTGIISSKCDISVHLSCLNTWCYLLHKLDLSINHPLVIELVLDPVFEAVFGMGPDTKTIWLWSFCLDLLDDFVIAKCRKVDYDTSSQVSHHSSVRTSILGPSISGKCLVKQHSIKWYPWDISQLDFFIKMINVILTHASVAKATLQNRSSASDAALRIFISLLQGIQMELKSSSINYVDIVLYFNTILRFLRETCEKVDSDGSANVKLQHNIQFLQAVIDELEPSILGSPLYKVALDIKCIENLQSVNHNKYEKILCISSIAYMDMVSPLAYLIILCICVVIKSTSDALSTELISQRLHKFFKLILFSHDPLENLQTAIGLLFKYVHYNRNLHIWIVVAEALKDCISGVEDLSMFKIEPESNGYLGIFHLLSYPFVALSSPQQMLIPEKVSRSLEESHVSAQRSLELDHVIEVWKSVYGALSASKCFATKSISDNLCSILNWCIDENLSKIGCGTELDLSCKDLNINLLSLSGNAVAFILDEVLATSSDGNKTNHAIPQTFSDIRNILGFASRFLNLSWAKIRSDSPTVLLVTSRVFSALTSLVRCLHLKQTILSVIEIITCPLVQWLSHGGIHDGNTNDQLQRLWAEILDCLKRSQPPIVFDSLFLKLQAPLLEKTLDHPDCIISELTITFWNSTYGEQINLDYPERLLDVLDKLSRTEKIKLHKKSLPFLVKCNSKPEFTAQRYKVTAMHSRSSKRVELMEDTVNQFEHKDKLCSSSKRKRLELTEHQKEVRRAQQGREMDCNGHGPGVRTYTTVDFSQGNEDSQESQEIRNPESILEMLRRVA
ncbi:uncharacterized protein LOC110660052 isoform X2 [Hevea brasiliensis]|uniref:uncharacterized protein LOC110660052 isoform X2 n=1 Tax=Hevea brasiliensis TaxID=3981 RepID=UPI0025E01252|nr:uncharacterized protein LOC110660052 isoform X2 [Hevea brasiliensis]